MNSRSRLLAFLLVAVAGFAAAGDSVFQTGETLRPGDIVLARSYGLVGAMFARHGSTPGRFSHGALVYRAADGRLMMINFRPTKMETCTPEEYFSRYNRLALVRYAGDIGEARPRPETGLDQNLRGEEAISAAARRWLAINDLNKIPPDYNMDPANHDAMFCLEVIMAVYEDCGLPNPFAKSVRVDCDPVIARARQLFNANVQEVTSPSAVLESPQFTLVSEWLKPDYDLRMESLNESLVQAMVDYLAEGYVPRDPNLLGKMKLAQILFLYRTSKIIMFWKRSQPMPAFIDKKAIYNGYMFFDHIWRAKKKALKRIEAETCPIPQGTDPAPTLARVAAITREECDSMLEKYYVRCYGPQEVPMACILPNDAETAE